MWCASSGRREVIFCCNRHRLGPDESCLDGERARERHGAGSTPPSTVESPCRGVQGGSRCQNVINQDRLRRSAVPVVSSGSPTCHGRKRPGHVRQTGFRCQRRLRSGVTAPHEDVTSNGKLPRLAKGPRHFSRLIVPTPTLSPNPQRNGDQAVPLRPGEPVGDDPCRHASKTRAAAILEVVDHGRSLRPEPNGAGGVLELRSPQRAKSARTHRGERLHTSSTARLDPTHPGNAHAADEDVGSDELDHALARDALVGEQESLNGAKHARGHGVSARSTAARITSRGGSTDGKK